MNKIKHVIQGHFKQKEDYDLFTKNIPSEVLESPYRLQKGVSKFKNVKLCIGVSKRGSVHVLVKNGNTYYINKKGDLDSTIANSKFRLGSNYYVVYDKLLNTRYNRLKMNVQHNNNAEFINIG
jgi:hypothetical protein